jgi:DNA-binding protein YbaB
VKIEIGVTHQVRINGESAWIKLSIEDEFVSTDKLGRDTNTFIESLAQKVNDKVIEICEQTAQTVTAYTGGK